MNAPGKPFLIEMENVSFAYDEGSLALKNVNFRVRAGEFVSMLASNGSGKTTLIKVLAKLLTPQQGTVRIAGRDVRAMTAGHLYQQIGLLLQDPNDQLFAPTVEDDVAFGPRNLGLPDVEVEQRAEESLAAVGVAALRKRAIHHLSFGERKRVCLAGVLAMRPKILVLDEPTAGLDPAGESQMLQLLSRLNREQGISLVLATHSVDLLPLFADRIYVLNRGEVVKDGAPEEIFADQEMMHRVGLRLPYISRLIHEMRCYDGVRIEGLPLTLREARLRLLELIPPQLIMESLKEKTP